MEGSWIAGGLGSDEQMETEPELTSHQLLPTRPGLVCISSTTLSRSNSRISAVSLTPEIVCRGLLAGRY
jgi:hypothetical protein